MKRTKSLQSPPRFAGNSMSRAASLLAVLVLCAANVSCGSGASGEEISTGSAPALVIDQSRRSDASNGLALINDFDRIIFIKPGITISTIGKNNGVQLRAFVSATAFYQPPLTVEQVVAYAGGVDRADLNLAVMRCRPPDRAKVEPTLATWPNVFKALTADLGKKFTPADCPADLHGLAPHNQVYCLARSFADNSNSIAVFSLAPALGTGAAIFSVNNPPPKGQESGGDGLFDLYGIGSEFSGLGFTVRDSANVSLNSAQVLQQSVVPEYLLNNVTLSAGGCNCIEVAPYDGRDQTPLNLDFVSAAGKLGECTPVNALPG
jgi:hypothetical protein